MANFQQLSLRAIRFESLSDASASPSSFLLLISIPTPNLWGFLSKRSEKKPTVASAVVPSISVGCFHAKRETNAFQLKQLLFGIEDRRSCCWRLSNVEQVRAMVWERKHFSSAASRFSYIQLYFRAQKLYRRTLTLYCYGISNKGDQVGCLITTRSCFVKGCMQCKVYAVIHTRGIYM